MIPWKYSFTTDLTVAHVMKRIERATDTRPRTWSQVAKDIWDTKGPCLGGIDSSATFEGTINMAERTFYLTTFLPYAWKGSRTAFTGRVCEHRDRSRIDVWISSSRFGLGVIAFFGIGFLFATSTLVAKVISAPSTKGYLLLLVPAYGLTAFTLADIWINRRARKLFKALFDNSNSRH
jgi:hypothetical protein